MKGVYQAYDLNSADQVIPDQLVLGFIFEKVKIIIKLSFGLVM